MRIRTTGGGGWGDPLERPVDEVLRDVRWGKVSVAGAHDDYGVVVQGEGDALRADEAATGERRRAMRAARRDDEPFFDRGPGYATLSGGERYAEVDVL